MKITLPQYIPSTPGVYKFLWKGKKILYIGKAKDLSKRVKQYFMPGSMWKQDMMYSAVSIEFIQTTTEEEALLLEEALIKQYKPDYNKLLKHNTNYLYIRYTNEEFPKVEIVRKRKNDKATYVGPKQRSKMLYNTMKYLRRIFKRRTMSKVQFNKWIIDMDFHLWLDQWRSLINKMDTDEGIEKAKTMKIDTTITREEYKKEYWSRLKLLKKFLEWDTKSILKHLEGDIEKHAELQNFERCSSLRDMHSYILERESRQQAVVQDTTWTWYHITLYALKAITVIVSIKLFEGKIIDIITEQYSSSDRDITEIAQSITVEYEVTKYHQDEEKISLLTKPNSLKWKKKRNMLDAFSKTILDSYIASHAFDKHSVMSELLMSLQQRYELKEVPYQIECVDISHFSWSDASGWISNFLNGLPMKKGYRQYKIAKENAGDDYASLKEVLTRRFWLAHDIVEADLHLPELFIIDGGKGQLWILEWILEEYPTFATLIQGKMTIVALWKGSARSRKWKSDGNVEIIYKMHEGWVIEYPLLYDQADQLLVRVRDEAHRFSNRYRKKQMSSERKSTTRNWKRTS